MIVVWTSGQALQVGCIWLPGTADSKWCTAKLSAMGSPTSSGSDEQSVLSHSWIIKEITRGKTCRANMMEQPSSVAAGLHDEAPLFAALMRWSAMQHAHQLDFAHRATCPAVAMNTRIII